MWVVCTVVNAQSIGSKVRLVGVDGKNYTGIITNVQNGNFMVKYDGYDFDAWLTSNQFTVVNTTTQNQPVTKQETKTKSGNSSLYLGEYATYGYGGGLHLMTNMGFILLPNGQYYDLHKGRGGTYVYDGANGTIKFTSGFLGGQGAKDVTTAGFWLTKTVYCEPWKQGKAK